MENNNEPSTDYRNFGTYPVEEVEMMKAELEKNGIPVKVLYPGTNVGREYAANAKWSSQTLLIQENHMKAAIEIREGLGIIPQKKMRTPQFMFTQVNRIAVIIFVLSFIVFMLFNKSAVGPIILVIGVLALLAAGVYQVVHAMRNR